MYYLDITILILQILPPNWRYHLNGSLSHKVNFLNTILSPFKSTLNDFYDFRKRTKREINLSPQVIIIENYIKELTGQYYGVYIVDEDINKFKILIPNQVLGFKNKIIEFLTKIIPAGRLYTINFY